LRESVDVVAVVRCDNGRVAVAVVASTSPLPLLLEEEGAMVTG